LFRLTSGGAFDEAVFRGDTINTPSMLAVEDALDGLRWAERIGGMPALVARCEANLRIVARWVERTPWVDFLAARPALRSPTSICLKLAGPEIARLEPAGQAALLKNLVARLEAEGVAYDIASYREAPPGLRLWGGATVEQYDLEALLPWLDWAFGEAMSERRRAPGVAPARG
jgi:phosphoserine aminotransferase